MMFNQTGFQVIEFGDEPEDKFYCLINLKVSPNGMNIEKLRLSDPRNFDRQFSESGCLLMLTGDEFNELVNRGEIDKASPHKSLFELAIGEGIIKKTGH
jgi:hypothetical protein